MSVCKDCTDEGVNAREAGEPFKTALCAQAGEALPLICAGVKGYTSRIPASSGFKALIPDRHASETGGGKGVNVYQKVKSGELLIRVKSEGGKCMQLGMRNEE